MTHSRQHRLLYQNYLELSRILSASKFICQIQGEKVKKIHTTTLQPKAQKYWNCSVNP